MVRDLEGKLERVVGGRGVPLPLHFLQSGKVDAVIRLKK